LILFSGMAPFICANNCKSNLFWDFIFLMCNVRMCKKSCHILIIIYGMPSFVCANDASRICFGFYFLVCNRSYVANNCKSCLFQILFWRAIVCMCGTIASRILFWIYFLVCNCSYVQTIASLFILFYFGMQLLYVWMIAKSYFDYYFLYELSLMKVWGHGRWSWSDTTTQKTL